MKNNQTGGISFYGVLILLLITLKLTGVITWSWWWVLSPIWSVIVIILLILIIAVIMKDSLK